MDLLKTISAGVSNSKAREKYTNQQKKVTEYKFEQYEQGEKRHAGIKKKVGDGPEWHFCKIQRRKDGDSSIQISLPTKQLVFPHDTEREITITTHIYQWQRKKFSGMDLYLYSCHVMRSEIYIPD